MTLHWSASTGGFYDTDVIPADQHPADAVEITAARHAQLMTSLGEGRTLVAGDQGQPLLAPIVAPSLAECRLKAQAAARGEAQRRILTLAPLWTQSNDNALVADLSWRAETDLSFEQTLALAEARTRRSAIDAIRAASNVLETAIETMDTAALDALDPAADVGWP